MSGLPAEQWCLSLGDTRLLCAWLWRRAHHLLTSEPKARDRQLDALKMCLVALTHIAGHTVLRDTWIWFKARPWKGLILDYTAALLVLIPLCLALFFFLSLAFLLPPVLFCLFIPSVIHWVSLVLLFCMLDEAKVVLNVGIHPASYWLSFHLLESECKFSARKNFSLKQMTICIWILVWRITIIDLVNAQCK